MLEVRNALIAFNVALVLLLPSNGAVAGPDAEVAKRCLRAAYLVFPYKRPGSAPMNGDRLHFFRQCVAQDGTTSAEPAKRD